MSKREKVNALVAAKRERRRQWFEKVANEANNIVNLLQVRTHLPEAARRMEHLLQNAVMVDPVMTSAKESLLTSITLPKDNGGIPLLVFAHFDSDAQVGPNVAYFLGRGQQSSYAPVNHMVCLDIDLPETIRFTATSLLHEVGHAMAAQQDGRMLANFFANRLDERSRLQEELQMWLFDGRLIQLLGGDQLTAAMHQTAAEMLGEREGGNMRHKLRPGIGRHLDLCYGPVSDSRAAAERDQLYLSHCYLLAAGMTWSPFLAYESQLAFIKQMYENNWKNQEKLLQDYRNRHS